MKKKSIVRKRTRATNRSRSLSLKSAELLSYAQKVAETTDDWMQVFNAIYAPGAMYGRLFPTKEERIEFAGTDEHKQLYELLWKLRDEHGDRETDDPPAGSSGSFVVRMPRALHAALAAEADEQGVSLNLLCVSKLAMKLSDSPPKKVRRRPLQAG